MENRPMPSLDDVEMDRLRDAYKPSLWFALMTIMTSVALCFRAQLAHNMLANYVQLAVSLSAMALGAMWFARQMKVRRELGLTGRQARFLLNARGARDRWDR